ncbi:MAG: hypothetical protein L0271_17155 [Gemmatimonadetes bacterium]|nr:hypothetical protein [Gemmatimonadota bacterium]
MPEYRAFGLRLKSQVELEDLGSTGPVIAGPPVSIVLGPVPDPPADASEVGPTLHVHQGDVTLGVPGLARFLIRDGREVIIAPDAGTSTIDFAPMLTGSVLALVCHQRGLLPVRASAVQVQDGGVLFVGPPCVGKSTVAAALCGRGHPLIADDLCVIHAEDKGQPLAYPGPPCLRLWEDSLAGSGARHEALRRVRPQIDKYVVPVMGSSRAVHVRHVVVIDVQGRDREFDRRVGIDAVTVVIASSWMPRVLDALGATARHFELSAAVARSAAIWHWTRPDSVAKLPGALAGLEAAWRAAVRSMT